jgi:hypothetical protein
MVIVVLRFRGVELRPHAWRAGEEGSQRMRHGGLLFRGGSATSLSRRRLGPTDDELHMGTADGNCQNILLIAASMTGPDIKPVRLPPAGRAV